MGSCKWGYKSPNIGYNHRILFRTLRIATHEPPSVLVDLYCKSGTPEGLVVQEGGLRISVLLLRRVEKHAGALFREFRLYLQRKRL